MTHLHEGIERDQASDATGWELRFADDLKTVDPPTSAELEALHDLLAS
jgi:hypothetical protein